MGMRPSMGGPYAHTLFYMRAILSTQMTSTTTTPSGRDSQAGDHGRYAHPAPPRYAICPRWPTFVTHAEEAY